MPWRLRAAKSFGVRAGSIESERVFHPLVPGHDDLTFESVVGWRGTKDALLMFLARSPSKRPAPPTLWHLYEP